jgi:hypothetical protein
MPEQWSPETTDHGWHWLRHNLEWRSALCDQVGVGWRVSDLIGRTARILTAQISAEPSTSGRAANCQNDACSLTVSE